MFIQPDVSPNADEMVEISEILKAKERRRKREQDVQTTNFEEAPLGESPSKAASKKKKRGHKDSRPNNAHSCVEDNTFKVILEFFLI